MVLGALEARSDNENKGNFSTFRDSEASIIALISNSGLAPDTA